MGIPAGYTSGQVVQAVPTGINSALVCVKAETAFSAVSSVIADNVFTSTYTNYRINFRSVGGSDNSIATTFRVGGVAATTNYNYQLITASGTVADGTRGSSQSNLLLFPTSTNESYATIEISCPNLAAATNGTCASQWLGTGVNFRGSAFIHTTATAYDGIGFAPSSGTITGTYSIYGYAKTV